MVVCCVCVCVYKMCLGYLFRLESKEAAENYMRGHQNGWFEQSIAISMFEIGTQKTMWSRHFYLIDQEVLSISTIENSFILKIVNIN